MKRGVFILLALSPILYAQESGTKVEERQIPVVKCSEPTHSVMVMELDCKANACQQANPGTPHIAYLYEVLSGSGGVRGIGSGITTMLVSALKATNCFRIVDLEQFEKMKRLLAATGQQVQPPKVDYVISGSITALELERSGGALGGGFIPILGAINVRKDRAKLGADINVINPQTLEVAFSKSFNADSERSSWGLFGAGWGGSGAGGGGWSVSKNLSLDMVARDVVVQVANSIAEKLASGKIVERPAPPQKEKREEGASN
ncbi:MAG: curli assembly protein CsgG [Acidobacteria bacterium]|jgi:curli biogenesis system outer membrane secretion channel CsgG|nr:MAG: curli assembly protein CsgG [Acidobacteriota bacterium]